MKSKKVDKEEFKEWLNGHQVTYASSSREQKRLQVGLDGHITVSVGGVVVYGSQTLEAVDVYNSITVKYINPLKDFRL